MSREERNAWIEKAKERMLANEKRTDAATLEIMMLYDEAAVQVEKEISTLFSRYGRDNHLSDAEASRLLSGKEYRVWRKSMEEYIADATGPAKDSKAMLELNTLAMKSRISRKEELLSNIYRNMMELAGTGTEKLEALLGDLVRVNYYEGCFRIQQGIKMAFSVAKINESLVRRVLEYPWSEKHFSEAVWGQCDRLAALAKREISLGLIQGSSVQQMAKAIDDVMDKGRYAAERLVRTECKYFANQGELAAYRENGITKYRFVGGSEGSTSACGCAELNGAAFDISDAQPGVNFPPLHPNCLCTVVAVFERSMFTIPKDAKPLKSNVKFQEWKKRCVDTSPGNGIIRLKEKSFGEMLKELEKNRGAPIELARVGTEDKLLKKLMHEAGADGLPQLISPKHFAQAVKDGRTAYYRGVSGRQYADAFRTGECFVGQGVLGNGIYLSKNRKYSLRYADGDERALLEVLLSPAATVVSVTDLEKDRRAFAAYLQENLKGGEIGRGLALAKDRGKFALMRGYDAVDYGDNLLVLNRTALEVVMDE